MKNRTGMAMLLVAGAASMSSAAVIYDQYNNPTAGSYASQQFEAANVAFNCMAIDDFTVGAGNTLQSIDFSFVYYNGVGPTTGWHVAIFSSPAAAVAGNMVGDIANVTGLAGGQAASPAPTFLTLNLGNIPLAAGTYWIGVQGIMDFTPGGQVGIQGRSVISGTGARFINPGLGFGTGADSALGGATPVDVGFRLNGLVPAPGSLALIGLSGLAALRRRR